MNEIPEHARAFLTEEEIQRYYSPDRNSSKVKVISNGKNHHVRALRQEKGLSQSELADKMGLTKGSLQRLENKSWTKLSIDELEILAKAFDTSSEELLCLFKFNSNESNEDRVRLSQKDPFFVSEILEGIRIETYVRRPRDFFIGTLIIPAQKTLSSDRAPKADFIFYGVLKGDLLLTLPEKSYVLKTGSRFSLDEGMPYELYNSHQFREAVLMLHTSPSFI